MPLKRNLYPSTYPRAVNIRHLPEIIPLLAHFRSSQPGKVMNIFNQQWIVCGAATFRAANKTPWRCCVTLAYCLYCLRSHA